MALSDIGPSEAGGLVRARAHPGRLSARRAAMIVARARLVAGLFAVLTPLWILLDLWALAPEVWRALAPMRLLTAAAFACALVLIRGMHTLRDAYRALAFLYAIPALFYLGCYAWALGLEPGVLDGFLAGYAYLPFVMLAALALFPLTVAEGACFAALMLLLQTAALASGWPQVDWPGFIASFSVLALIAGVATLAGLSQLAFLIVNVRDGIHDSLTGCYSRRCGEELLDLQYALSVRGEADLALALVALDDFQAINARFGYAAGDATLRNATEVLHDSMRAGDLLVRWTGDQFLLVLPGAALAQAESAIQRLLSGGLGVRPDRAPVSASVGLAERRGDSAEDWWRLVDLAEARMRRVREAGGNRTLAG
ncbi:MAG TPA: GGDEF domain-containing protein [Burkholderiales bacterium]|nr:GGDEF domain-containing protein [Burkholderiales bacterium]